MKQISSLRAQGSRIANDEDGSATIEAVLWIPFFFSFLLLVADASLMFQGQARVLRIVQDSNRAVAVGRIETTADAEAFIRSRLAGLSPRAQVNTTRIDGLVQTTVDMPATDLSSLGVITKIRDFTIRASAEQFFEN